MCKIIIPGIDEAQQSSDMGVQLFAFEGAESYFNLSVALEEWKASGLFQTSVQLNLDGVQTPTEVRWYLCSD